MTVVPAKLNRGDTIGIISPASSVDHERLQRGIDYLEGLGYRIKLGRHLHKSYGSLAGRDAQRIEDINAMFADPQVRAIFCARGGYGTPRILDSIDYDNIKQNPKIFVGYSDITALQLAIFAKAKLVTFSGPMVAVEMSGSINAFTEANFWRSITADSKDLKLTLRGHQERDGCEGKPTGCLLGGCLSLLCTMVGTSYLPDLEGAVLFLEDVGEPLYRIDRKLMHLKLAGILNRLSAVVLGSFEGCGDDADGPSLTMNQIIQDIFGDLSVPVLRGLPYGHIEEKYTIPCGVNVDLNCEAGYIQMLESATC